MGKYHEEGKRCCSNRDHALASYTFLINKIYHAAIKAFHKKKMLSGISWIFYYYYFGYINCTNTLT